MLAFALPEEIPNDLFGVSMGLSVGCIDEVSPSFQVVGKNRFRVLNIRSKARAEVFSEGHGSKAKGANAKAGPAECHIRVQWHGYFCFIDWSILPM